MIDCVDDVGDSFAVFDDRNQHSTPAIWNGREVSVIDPEQLPQFASFSLKIFQFPDEPQPFPHVVTILDLLDEEPSEFSFAPCTFSEQFTLSYFQQPAEILLCKSFFHRIYHEMKKGAKKTANLVKKALKAIAHGTKKAAKQVEDFVKEHKKEVLIATAVIAAVSGAYLLSGVLSGSAAAANPPPRKKEDEDGDKATPSSPPSNPPPLPDWVQGLINSTSPDFSPATVSDSWLEDAKGEAHNAWETLNHLKAVTEADLAHLKKEDPKFDPTKAAIETILNTVLNEAQRHEFSKTSAAQQHWQDLIRNGHERIDQAFSVVAAHKTAAIPPAPQIPTFSFADKIKLGLEIIGRGMLEPELLDTNTRLDIFLKDHKITVPIENPNQTVSEFVNKIKQGLETIRQRFIGPELLDPDSPLDLFFKPQNAELYGINLTQTVSQFFSDLRQKLVLEETFVCKLDRPLPLGAAANSEELKSRFFKTEGVVQKGMQITFINGILCKFNSAFGHAEYIQKLNPSNLSIDGIYNHSNGPMDLLEAIFLNYPGYSPVTQNLLMQKWTEFHEKNKNSPNAKILHFCHSQGAIHTNNALILLPEEIRERVIVVAIAPAEVVPFVLCHKSFNYASKKDLVPKAELFSAYWRACCFLDFKTLANSLKNRDELILLEPHEGATGTDHDFQTPTFVEVIIDHLQNYDANQGEYL